MEIITVVGARPQLIKAATVSAALAAAGVTETLVHTGQHYDTEMSELFFEELGIPTPALNLGVRSTRHGEMTARMLEQLEPVLLDRSPDVVLVYGDTNSTLAGALAASKLNIPIAHVEAGLRSFNRRMPEEVNRVVTDHLATWLFAPTPTAVANLHAEGITGPGVVESGDVMYDVALAFGERARTRRSTIDRLGLTDGGYVLATVHRAENTDDPARLSAILTGLAEIALDLPVVLPLHPRTHAALVAEDLTRGSSLHLITPVGYLEMVSLEQHARVIVTDSGGVQKEAFFHRVPCVTVRDETEWVELVTSGWNRLCPPTSGAAVSAAVRAAMDAPTPAEVALYGDGNASKAIAQALISG